MSRSSLFGLLAFVSLAAIACSKEDDEDLLPQDTGVRLSALREGQQSMYLRYKTNCAFVNDSFQFTADTLMLEVIRENDQLFFKESLTPARLFSKMGVSLSLLFTV